jgi:hypothetical protein
MELDAAAARALDNPQGQLRKIKSARGRPLKMAAK